jgi:hypothetical protein
MNYYILIHHCLIALINTLKARIIINIASPTSNHFGFVFREKILPILAPAIEPIKTEIAGSHIKSPLAQYTGIAPKGVKIVTHNEVAIAWRVWSPNVLKSAG